MKKIIIVSAINLVEGGPLAVLEECLRYVSANLSDEYKIIVLVNRKQLFPFKKIKYLEFPKSKKSWVNRLYYEYYYFSKLAKRLKPFLWLSLHDITPNVTAPRLAVYCHNASPFYELSFKEAIMDPKFALFNTFYKYLYMINIKKSDFVIVQQDWLRQEFIKAYKIKNVIVSYPSLIGDSQGSVRTEQRAQGRIFFYPAFPRIFKNFEVIFEATKILNARGIKDFSVYFTFNGTENKYAKFLLSKYASISQINFIGLQARQKIEEYYRDADCLIFASKLETWGLPITEFMHYNKPMLLSDLAFAHETAGAYNKAAFFKPDDPKQLASLMEGVISNNLVFSAAEQKYPAPPFAENWNELFNNLLQ